MGVNSPNTSISVIAAATPWDTASRNRPSPTIRPNSSQVRPSSPRLLATRSESKPKPLTRNRRPNDVGAAV